MEEIQQVTYPDSPLGENNVLMGLGETTNNIQRNNEPEESYANKLLQESINNTRKPLVNKEINIIEDFRAIFPLGVSMVFFMMLLILIYVYFF